MSRYIDAWKLIEYANNQKDKTVDANDIARFPTADVVPMRNGEHAGLDMIAMKVVDDVIGMNAFPSPCTNCRNNPVNGGSGICHCILGGQTIC